MKHLGILVIVAMLALAVGSMYLLAAEQKNTDEKPLTKVDKKTDDAPAGDEAAPGDDGVDSQERVIIRRNGRVQVWVNGKKVVDKTLDDEGTRSDDDFEKELNDLLDKHFPETDDAPRIKENRADVRVETENGEHRVFINGRRVEISPNDEGSVTVKLKVDKNGEARLEVNGEARDLPKDPFAQGGSFGLRRKPGFSWGFDFDFDESPMGRLHPRLRRNLDKLDMDDVWKEFERMEKEFSKLFGDTNRMREQLRKFLGEDPDMGEKKNDSPPPMPRLEKESDNEEKTKPEEQKLTPKD